MSGFKDERVLRLHRKLKARGTSVGKVADQIFCGRSHVSQVIAGTRAGRHTWPKLERVLTAEELAIFGRVPRGTFSHMEQEVRR